MFFTLDRIEENAFAVLTDDNGKVYSEKLSALPENSRTGDVFTFKNGVYVYDAVQTAERKQRIAEKRNKFFNKLKKNKEE